jgi:hypothetical protein
MTSAAAADLWSAFREGPKQLELQLDQRREAGETMARIGAWIRGRTA